MALRSQVGEITHSEGKFRIGDKVIAVMPMGLKDDSDLSSLGVTSHSMEDYLMKMLLLDESLRPLGSRFPELLEGLGDLIRAQALTFDSSKELFQLTKPILKQGFSDTGLVRWMFSHAVPDILHSVMDPLIERLEQAVGT